MKLFYNPDYSLASHSFDTTRKAGWVAESVAADPVAGVELVAPRPATATQLIQIHDPHYVDAIATGEPHGLATSQGFPWDSGVFPMVSATNGGAVDAALAALSDGVAGSLSSGLHHARRDSGAGFCTFNGLVLAARSALDAGARNVLILDLDAHCGGGTASLIDDDERIWHTDVSVDPFDRYASSQRSELTEIRDSRSYLPAVASALGRVESTGPGFDLVLYNAGMDPFEGCDIGGLHGIDHDMLAERERMVFDWARVRGIPIAFVLAGGYVGSRLDQNLLVELHRLTVAAAAHRADAASYITV